MSDNKHRLNQLQTLLKIKETEKQIFVKQLAEVREQFQYLKNQLDKMLEYRNEYQSQINSIGEKGCNINQMRNRIAFISQLDMGITQLNQQLVLVAKQRKQCEIELVEKQKKVQAVEKLIESGKKVEIHQENVREQKENDEYARKQWYNDNN